MHQKWLKMTLTTLVLSILEGKVWLVKNYTNKINRYYIVISFMTNQSMR